MSLSGLLQLSALLGLTFQLSAGLPEMPLATTRGDDACRIVAEADRPVTTVVYIQPVYVNTYVSENTSITVDNDLTIVVDDAPTSLNIITTRTSMAPNDKAVNQS